MTTTSIEAALQETFPPLVLTHVHYVAFGDKREFTLSHTIYGRRLYGDGADRAKTVLDALESLFRQLNHVDGSELISDPEFNEIEPRLRSFSVGDCVTFRGPGGWRREFVCLGCGWGWREREPLPEPETSREAAEYDRYGV